MSERHERLTPGRSCSYCKTCQQYWPCDTFLREQEREALRISFAYGNVHLSNPEVTRETVERAAARLRGEPDGSD